MSFETHCQVSRSEEVLGCFRDIRFRERHKFEHLCTMPAIILLKTLDSQFEVTWRPFQNVIRFLPSVIPAQAGMTSGSCPIMVQSGTQSARPTRPFNLPVRTKIRQEPKISSYFSELGVLCLPASLADRRLRASHRFSDSLIQKSTENFKYLWLVIISAFIICYYLWLESFFNHDSLP